MLLVEMVFTGEGGLEQWVQQVAERLEALFDRHEVAWRTDYPITLRESLRLGLQQQIVGSHAYPPVAGKRQDYRVWMQLPGGGLRAWTALLTYRVLAGCGKEELSEAAPLRQDLQRALVESLGPCLERPERPLVAAGS